MLTICNCIRYQGNHVHNVWRTMVYIVVLVLKKNYLIHMYFMKWTLQIDRSQLNVGVCCRYMYWTDWSASHPRIVRAWMDGTHNETIVSGYRVHWPNGITIDFRSDKIYWTDAYKHGIYSANSDGQHVQVLKSGSYYIPHPYSIGVFKVGFLSFISVWN